MEKPAATKHDILDVLQRRWSPRAFADTPVESDKLNRIFEATRWAASSFNEQPWRFILATKDQPEEYQKVLSCLVEKNQAWAQYAPVIGLTLAKKTFTRGGKPNRVYIHDVGLAMGNFTAQATAEGLFVHQMAGIDAQKVIDTFDVPDDFEPVAGFALGYGGEAEALPEDWMRDAEQQRRSRSPFADFVFTGKFGQASDVVSE
jgi:nitroreductase